MQPKESALLRDHARRFDKRIEKVADGIYSAIGYALGNIILLVTDEGNIIIDTTESIEAAQEIKAEFDRISDKPTLAIIYTHGHPDHIWGAPVFFSEQTEVYAHQKLPEFFNEQFNQLWPVLNARGARQFGIFLPEGHVPCSALGPYIKLEWADRSFVSPTTLFDDRLELTIGGVRLLLEYAPGETDDQIFIWLPERNVLFCGDNYYPAFPNLYTIRGTSPRPVARWINSLDKMRDLGAEYLVPSHTEPVRGAARINELLTIYRDAIQYIHDAVVRGANQGKTADQLVEEITLPPHLAQRPELMELYGKVSWSVRAIYDGYLGWFDGNATGLEPLSPRERAEKIIALAGSREKLRDEGHKGIERGQHQWAAEVADLLLASDPDDREARKLKADTLFKLGEVADNSNARSYYFRQSLELAGELRSLATRMRVDAATTHTVLLERVLENMAVRLDPVASADIEISARFKMTGTGVSYMVIIRRGIAEIRPGCPADPDLTIVLPEDLCKEIALGVTDPIASLEGGDLEVEGNRDNLIRFFGLFKFV